MMIEAASLYTFEIDEPQVALADLRGQLAGQLRLKKHTAGILQCDAEFIASGVVAHICSGFDFPIVGGTCAGQATHGAAGDLMLTLLVLTSDEAQFVAARTDGLEEDLFGAVAGSYEAVRPSLPTPPKLILVFPPIIEAFAGDWYVEAFERLCGKTPVFGTLAVDDAITVYDRCATVCSGEIMAREMAYLLICGEINPRFFVASVPGETTLPERCVITRAKDNIVYEINGERAIDYFESVNLAQEGVLCRGVDFVPFLMTLEGLDGAPQRPFVRALIRFEADGSAICRGAMYEGAAFTIGSNSGADVIAATEATVERINAQADVHAALIFSCVVRRMTLGADSKLELTKVRQALRPDIPFMMAYSGGEIAPTEVVDGEAVNRFHNYSFIACLL